MPRFVPCSRARRPFVRRHRGNDRAQRSASVCRSSRTGTYGQGIVAGVLEHATLIRVGGDAWPEATTKHK